MGSVDCDIDLVGTEVDEATVPRERLVAETAGIVTDEIE
jgi:hypothetical protein